MNEPLGLVDGSTPSNTRRFHVVLDERAVAQLDDLVTTTQVLPDGTELHHYGIVVEGLGQIEGAELPSDTQRIAGARTMPGTTTRRVEVQTLRTVPELWIPPAPGAEVRRAAGAHRDAALFLDQMDHPLAVGLDQNGLPIMADFAFINGEKGGHVSISGVSGVATKTSYALFLLYMLFETEEGRRLLGAHSTNTRALVFNVKGEDLLQIDRPNRRFAQHEEALTGWRALGVPDPGAFRRVRLYAPRSEHSRQGSLATDVVSRTKDEVVTYGWPPADFIREGLLRFCFAEDEDARNQVGFVEQRVRVQLARWAYPLENEPGGVVLAPPPEGASFVFERVARDRRNPLPAGAGHAVREFGDLVDFLTARLAPENEEPEKAWTAGATQGTLLAFLRRLYAQAPRLGKLIARGVKTVELDEWITVVDIHSLHDSAQRFVVGALLARIFEEKQGQGREPLRFIVLDELNKYAPRQGQSPIKDVLIDIAARGRSLGVLLIGAQQSAGDVDGNVIRNAALKVAGRLDAGEAGEYRFLTAELRERAARFLPGTMVLDQPLIPAPLPLRFPFPAFATNVAEGRSAVPEAAARELFEKLLSRAMLLLHTADWHLGRTTWNHSRRIDHERVLAEIVKLAREHRPDLIVHAGDLFDAVRPPYEEIALGLDTLKDLAAVAPTVVLCGNHDSPALFRIFQKLLGPGSRLHFVDRARPPAAGGILDFAVGRQRLRLAPLPFVHQNRLVDAFEDPAQRTVAYADRIAVLEQTLGEGLLDGYDGTRDVLLFAAHLHVTGARISHSERELHISEGYATRPEHVPVVSYAAFGHIHRPQPLTGTTSGRYAGSPIQLDFGEVGDAKQVVLVELEPGQPARVQEIALESGRRLRHFVGTLAQLEAAAPSIGDEICLVTVDVATPVPDLSDRVAALLPAAVVVHVEERAADRRLTPAEELDTGAEEPTLVEHFRGYLEAQGTRTAAADRVLGGFTRLYEALAAEEEPSFPEERLLLDDEEPVVANDAAGGPEQMQLAGIDAPEPAPPRRRR